MKPRSSKLKVKSQTRTARVKQPTLHPIALITGPSPSRRFGSCLNLNFGQAGESCLWNCIYCPWHDPASKKAPARKASPETVSPSRYLSELQKGLGKKAGVDTVILGGSTEPSLYPELPELVSELLKFRKSFKATWKIVALSNGSGLLDMKQRAALEKLDQVWIKLDCAEDPLFRKTMRPAKGAPGFKSHLQALRSLGEVRIQTALWKFPGKSEFQNWSAENLKDLLEIYAKLKPAEIHLTTLKRHRNFAGVQPVTFEELEAFALRVAELGIATEVFP